MKKILFFTLVFALLLGLGTPESKVSTQENGECVRYSQGYWKKWLKENPDEENIIPGHDNEALLNLLNTPARGNPDVILSYQFIAAALNLYSQESCDLPEGTRDCDANDVKRAFDSAKKYLHSGEETATRSEILGWKNTLELWNMGYDPGFRLWEKYEPADQFSGLSAEKSYATFKDNGDGTGILTIKLFDMYGCPITENAATGSPLPNNTFRANSDSKANDNFLYIGGRHFNEPAYPEFSSSNRVHKREGVYEITLTSLCGYDQNWEIGIGSWLQRSQVIVIDEVNVNIVASCLRSVVYEGTCNLFGSHVGDKMTFTFSNDLSKDGLVNIYFTNFPDNRRLYEGWGVDSWLIQDNVLSVTVLSEYKYPRDYIGARVNQITNLVNSIGKPVVVPGDGVEVTGITKYDMIGTWELSAWGITRVITINTQENGEFTGIMADINQNTLGNISGTIIEESIEISYDREGVVNDGYYAKFTGTMTGCYSAAGTGLHGNFGNPRPGSFDWTMLKK